MWDNGPDGLVSLANERLYCAWRLRSARAALCPGGVLAVWSAYPDTSFSLRLRAAGYDVSGGAGHSIRRDVTQDMAGFKLTQSQVTVNQRTRE